MLQLIMYWQSTAYLFSQRDDQVQSQLKCRLGCRGLPLSDSRLIVSVLTTWSSQ